MMREYEERAIAALPKFGHRYAVTITTDLGVRAVTLETGNRAHAEQHAKDYAAAQPCIYERVRVPRCDCPHPERVKNDERFCSDCGCLMDAVALVPLGQRGGAEQQGGLMPEVPMKLTYCSFADDTGCLGVVVLEGEMDVLVAALTAHLLGINPGGEVIAFAVPDDEPRHAVYVANRNRLLTAAEARELFASKSLAEWEESDVTQ